MEMVSQRINFHSFSFQIAVYCFLIKLLKPYLLSGSIASNYY